MSYLTFSKTLNQTQIREEKQWVLSACSGYCSACRSLPSVWSEPVCSVCLLSCWVNVLWFMTNQIEITLWTAKALERAKESVSLLSPTSLIGKNAHTHTHTTKHRPWCALSWKNWKMESNSEKIWKTRHNVSAECVCLFVFVCIYDQS